MKETKLNTDTVLTKAETKVACGYTDGLIGKEIASRLGISYNTVVRHTQNIYDKAGIRRSTNALVAWFLARNFSLDLRELRQRVGAFILFILVSFQTVFADFDNSPVRRFPSRRIEARKGARKRGREEEGLEIELDNI